MYLGVYFSVAQFRRMLGQDTIARASHPLGPVRRAKPHAMTLDRRHALRQKVNTPAFASFDGVTGGMILDLSEEGLAMRSVRPPETHSLVSLHISLGEPTAHLETTGYVAWADALGRAGVRFSELPDEARTRLRAWLTEHASTPSSKAPRWVVRDSAFARNSPMTECSSGVALSLEAQCDASARPTASTTVQYEFKSLGEDLGRALRLIASRASTLTRGSGAAVALVMGNIMACRAAAGKTVPEIGAVVDTNQGLTGECLRQARALRCDDAQTDSRADWPACQRLGVRSIVAAPIIYERDIVGLLEVFSPDASAFDDGDVAVVERLAQTVLLTLSRGDAFRRK